MTYKHINQHLLESVQFIENSIQKLKKLEKEVSREAISRDLPPADYRHQYFSVCYGVTGSSSVVQH